LRKFVETNSPAPAESLETYANIVSATIEEAETAVAFVTLFIFELFEFTENKEIEHEVD